MEDTLLVVDGDMLAYRAAFASEYETKWDDDHWTLMSSESEMKSEVDRFFENLSKTLRSDNILPVFSPRENFRLELFPEYKANRRGKRKPLGLRWLVEWIQSKYSGVTAENMEADDLMGILCTRNPTNTVAVSGDKDFGTLPIAWYNPLKDVKKMSSPQEAADFHLVQTLSGDAADGYMGVKGVGQVTARKLMDKKGYTWETVVGAYEKAGMSEDDALLTARLAYILQDKDYNEETKEITLWTPKT